MWGDQDFLDVLSDVGQTERLLACIEFSKTVVSAYDMDSLLTAVLQKINGLIPARNWSLLLLDPQTQELYFAVVVGVDAELIKGIRLKLGEGIAGTVALTGESVIIPDVQQDGRFCSKVDEVTGFITRSIIALPLKVREKIIGVFEVVNVENQDFFRTKYLPLINILADYVAIAVDNVQNLQKLQLRTFIDECTGFYNTRFLAYQLDRLIPETLASGQQLSVVFLDVDNFKALVDSLGHLKGSKILAELARVIHQSLGPDDSLIRYGGDEFILLLPRCSQAQALELVRQLRRDLKEATFLKAEGYNIKLTASYGIATLPQDARDKDTLLLIADRAMFCGKGRGKDCIMLGRALTPVPDT